MGSAVDDVADSGENPGIDPGREAETPGAAPPAPATKKEGGMSATTTAARLLITAAASLAAATVTGQNLLVNPEFDASGAGWTEANDSVEAVWREEVGSTLAGGSGPGALEIRFSFWNGASSGVHQEVAVIAGTAYAVGVSFFAPATDNPAGDAPLFIDWYGSGGTQLGSDVLHPSPFVTGRWARISGRVTAPPDAVKARFFPAVTNPADPSETRPGVIWIDDALFGVEGTGVTAQELFLPAGASVPGLLGTHWTTDGWFHNRATTQVELLGAFLAPGADSSDAVSSPVSLATLSPGESLVLPDLVASLGGSGRTGGVYLRAEAQGVGQPLPFFFATSTTSTPNPLGGGAYGQGIPAVTAGGGAVQVAPGAFQDAARRTNVGALNTSDFAVHLEVVVLDGDGGRVAEVTWTLAPYEHRQAGLPSLGVASVTGGTVVFTRTSGLGSYRGYTSTVDAVTGDAVYTAGQ